MHMKMSKTNYQIQSNVEQKTEEWFAMREGLVTGSVAKAVKAGVRSGANNAYLYEVLATMTTDVKPKPLDSIEAIKWGNEQEPNARKAYETMMKVEVAEVGFIINGRLGLSPDGVVYGKKGNIIQTIEIKCPDTKNHIKYILNGGYPSEYKDQIIHNFVVIDDLKRLDFVSYDPRLKMRPLYSYTIMRESLGAEIEVAKISYTNHLKALDENYKKLIL
jgi:hypothetical protein